MTEQPPPHSPPEDPLPGGDPPGADRALRLLLADAGAEAREDHAEHGRGPGQAGLESAEGRDRAARDDRRPAAERAPRAQVDRLVQTARGHARRRRRHAARRARLRVPRSPRLDRDPPDPRLPRAEPALVRRSRQLLAGRQGADHLPRDRLRRDRPGARAGHHDHHQRRQTTPRRSRCCRRSACPSRARAARTASTRRPMRPPRPPTPRPSAEAAAATSRADRAEPRRREKPRPSEPLPRSRGRVS